MSAVLSDTELQIIKLRMLGFTRKQIADKTNRSELTIKTHYQNIMSKLNAKDELQVYLWYLEVKAGINIKNTLIGAVVMVAVVTIQVLFSEQFSGIVENVKAFISTYINF